MSTRNTKQQQGKCWDNFMAFIAMLQAGLEGREETAGQKTAGKICENAQRLAVFYLSSTQ